MTDHAGIDLDPLRDALAGEVVSPGDPGWDDARQAWNLVADQHPALVVNAAAPEDITATVRFAAANDMRVAAQSTGHGAPSLGDLTGAILLRTARLDGVVVDAEARTATVQAGACWRDVVAAASPHGLVALHGFSAGVGVAGYTLGGGLGWLARREGFASSHVRSFDVVTAVGNQLHVDATREPDLYWALRGGGGGAVVVTSLELELIPLGEVFAGSLLWPIEQASELVHAYREWISTVPDTLTSTVRLMRFPALPELPEPLRGRTLVSITLAFTGSEAEGNALVAPLRAVAAPYLDTLATVPASALGEISGDPPGPLPGIGNALLLASFPAEVADAFVELAGPGVDTPLIQLEIRHLGGALAHPSGDPGAAGAVSAEVLVYGVGMPVSAEVGTAIERALAAVEERLTPWIATPRTLLTFDERALGLRALFPPAVADRLANIIAAYDPDGRFVANQTVI
jgi:FAD/FMN-containing dehydrogenase